MTEAARTIHPAEILFEDGAAPPDIPVCDHYCGVEARMRKSLALQAELGPVFDVTLDCEDGAPVGAERAHATMVADMVLSPTDNRFGRVGTRVHPVDHPSFEEDLDILVGRAGERLSHVMIPKPRDAAELARGIRALERCARRHGKGQHLPVHALIETHGALRDVAQLAAMERVQSLSFGLMDFVSAHRGAIPPSAMGVQGQFSHPLVVRAKLEIAAACHAEAKVPSHSVVTEFKDGRALAQAAQRAAREFGYTRMWSIHPSQIRPIVDAFSPTTAEVDEAIEILQAAQAALWAPIRHRDTLHDRASYRYYWQTLLRARRTGQPLPAQVVAAWFAPREPDGRAA
ncbi:MAG: HpcH/HpaI aldolase/citrate lyase family protein [Aquabacterium sp.]